MAKRGRHRLFKTPSGVSIPASEQVEEDVTIARREKSLPAMAAEYPGRWMGPEAVIERGVRIIYRDMDGREHVMEDHHLIKFLMLMYTYTKATLAGLADGRFPEDTKEFRAHDFYYMASRIDPALIAARHKRDGGGER